jgi:tetratricopeptide (TPR) repeat protein
MLKLFAYIADFQRVPLLRAGFCIALSSFLFGCSNSSRPVAQNTEPQTANSERSQTAIAHSSEKQQPPAGGSKWTQSGDPIDTKELDATIDKAEKDLSVKPADAAAKKALGAAYLKRASALTGARQYASALGDYRRTLKYDPENAEAKQWIEQIISIYRSINRSYPNEGDEPPPLPFDKTKQR